MWTCKSKEVGNPTILLLPITTALFPAISTPDLINNSMQPLGVQGKKSGSLPLIARFPILSGWKPSTSLSRCTEFRILPSSKCCSTTLNCQSPSIFLKKKKPPNEFYRNYYAKQQLPNQDLQNIYV